MKTEDHPLVNKPVGSGSNNNPNKPKKDIPYVKIGVGAEVSGSSVRQVLYPKLA